MLNKIKHIILQLSILFLSFDNLMAQYLNYVDTTNDRHEVTLNYLKTNFGYISCGTTYYNDDSPGNFRNLEVKTYDENFNVLSIDRFGDTLSLYQPYALIKLGNYYYAGGFKMQDTISIGTINKIDTNGNILSEFEVFTDYPTVYISHLISKNNSIYIGGLRIDSTNNSSSFFAKADTLLNFNWVKTYDNSVFGESFALCDTTTNNGFILSIVNQMSALNTKSYLYKLDSLGNTEWLQIYGDNQHWNGLMCKELSNGNYFCCGGKSSTIGTNEYSDTWINILDDSGNLISDSIYSFSQNDDYAESNWSTTDGVFVSGRFVSGGALFVYISKFDFNGNLIWKRDFSPRSLENSIYSHIDLQNGFHFFGGWVSYDSGSNTNDEWFLVLDEFGCDVSSCNLSLNEIDKDDYFIIYPNPTNQDFTIQLPFENNVLIAIYNSIGELTYTTLTSNSIIEINTQNFENGIYFINVSSDNFFQSHKLIISK